jgi:iron complex transport system ATP-binding protein
MSVVSLSKVSVELRRRRILSEVSLSLEKGELVGLLGPNGAGKTTLLKALLGLITPARGQVLIAGRAAHELAPRERAARLAWLPQHVTLSEPLNVLEVVVAARFRFSEGRGTAERAARAALERVGMAAHADRRALELSGGERQRVALASLLAQDAELLLLDEPGNHLDPAQQLEIYRLLGELWRQGFGLLLVTHDVNLLYHLGAAERVRVVGLEAGRAVFETSYAAPELPEKLSSLFGVGFSAFIEGDQRVLMPRALGPGAVSP